MTCRHSLLLFSLAFLLFSPLAHAQGEDLTQDEPFFQEQLQTYERWLEDAGLSQYLRVHELEVKEDELNIYLTFPFSDIDSILVAYDSLKAVFEASSPLTLEQQLFYKATTLMEVRQSLVTVQIYDTYDLRNEPLFFRGIYFADGVVAVSVSNPRDKRRTVTLQPRPANDGKTPTIEAFRERYSRERVYDCIYEYARQRFERDVCEDRNPHVRLLQDQDVLRFEVSDLCREVLTDEANPTLCGILRRVGYDCNWVKRELLVFTFTYEETTTGFRLILLLDGKYGSGYYREVRRGGYLSMEVDFDDYLEDYADAFTVQLRRALQNCE